MWISIVNQENLGCVWGGSLWPVSLENPVELNSETVHVYEDHALQLPLKQKNQKLEPRGVRA